MNLIWFLSLFRKYLRWESKLVFTRWNEISFTTWFVSINLLESILNMHMIKTQADYLNWLYRRSQCLRSTLFVFVFFAPSKLFTTASNTQRLHRHCAYLLVFFFILLWSVLRLALKIISEINKQKRFKKNYDWMCVWMNFMNVNNENKYVK